MGLTNEERLTAEALEEMRLESERNFKATVKARIQDIAKAQKAVTDAMLALSKAREALKELKLEPLPANVLG